MPASSPRHTVLLIADSPDDRLTRAFPAAVSDVHFHQVKRAGRNQELCRPRFVPVTAPGSSGPGARPSNSLDVLEWLRQQPESRHIPVMVLSSDGEAKVVDAAYAPGANSCLLKSSDEQTTNDIARGIGTYATLVTN